MVQMTKITPPERGSKCTLREAYGGDAIDVKVNKRLLAFGAEEEGAVGGAILIKSFR